MNPPYGRSASNSASAIPNETLWAAAPIRFVNLPTTQIGGLERLSRYWLRSSFQLVVTWRDQLGRSTLGFRSIAGTRSWPSLPGLSPSRRYPMTTAAPSTALATIQPAFTDPERLALAGFLAGYRGLTKEKSCSASRCCRGVMKLGPFRWVAGAGRGGLGFCGGPGGGGRGGRCTVVAACRLSSLFTPGPFEAVKEFSCRDPLAGNHRCCCVRVCQSPVLAGVLAGGVPCPLSGGGCRCRRWLRESDV
jgi:hypothetical protein